MKNLKLGLFSLLAILAASVFLTSCEQDELDTLGVNPLSELQHPQNTEPMSLFFNDLEFINKTEDEVIEFVKSLSPEELARSKNDYIVAEYLTANDLFDEVVSNEDTKYLSELDLSKYINKSEIDEINSHFYDVAYVHERGCTTITASYSCPGICWRTVTINTPWGAVSSDVPYPCIKTCSGTIEICW